MKNDGVSAKIADSDHRAMSGASEHSVTELASALAMMHATLESTTDAILVTDEANYVREFNEKYVKFWGIPPHMMISAHASELWNYISPQLKDPAGYLARVHEIIASAAPETFDVLQLKDGRVFERNSAIQLITTPHTKTSSTVASGAPDAIFSNTLFSLASASCARLRRVMSRKLHTRPTFRRRADHSAHHRQTRNRHLPQRVNV
jgi:PAS domain-containing protein